MILKFRAWNKIDKVMIKDLNSPVMMHGVLLIHSDDILMQFTGLTDKNGKDIYEGDIVAREYQYGTFETGYMKQVEGMWCVYFDFEPESYFALAQDSSKHEVIGNIHQHPELMDRGNNND